MEYISILEAACQTGQNRPKAEKIVEALLKAEKARQQYDFKQLLGNWRLRFITGTKKTRAKAGVILGAGQYIPRLTHINLAYSEDNWVSNSVAVGFTKFTLKGPVKFLPPKNILAFDFTRISLKAFDSEIYQGYLPKGKEKELEFPCQKAAKQAFFSYFLITESLIAARGREGGLALWSKVI